MPQILACDEQKISEAAPFGYCIIHLGHIFDTNKGVFTPELELGGFSTGNENTNLASAIAGFCAGSGFMSSVFPLCFRLLAPAENAAVAPHSPRSELEMLSR